MKHYLFRIEPTLNYQGPIFKIVLFVGTRLEYTCVTKDEVLYHLRQRLKPWVQT